MGKSLDGGDYDGFVGKIVKVDWDDICGFSDSWMDVKDMYEMRPHKCYTIGLLFDTTEEYIIVAATWDHANTIVSDINCIPVGCVTNITVLGAK